MKVVSTQQPKDMLHKSGLSLSLAERNQLYHCCMHPLSASEQPAATVFCTRGGGGGAPPGQIPRFTFHKQFATTSPFKSVFVDSIMRECSAYFYFVHILLSRPRFSNTNLMRKEKMQIDTASSKISSGQVVRVAPLLHVLTQSHQWEAIQPSSNQTVVPISFRWIWNQQSWNSTTTAIPIMRSLSWHGERAGASHSVSVEQQCLCHGNPSQIWTLHQPSYLKSTTPNQVWWVGDQHWHKLSGPTPPKMFSSKII